METAIRCSFLPPDTNAATRTIARAAEIALGSNDARKRPNGQERRELQKDDL